MLQPYAPEIVAAPWTLRGDATVLPFRRGTLAFLRYTASSVGPYDELLWLQPFQRGPSGRAHHVSAIFVSSEASVRGGRANWGLPKELAVFRVRPQQAGVERVEVTYAGRQLASFLRAPFRAGLPLDLGQLPAAARRLVQHQQGRRFETVPEGRGRCGLVRIAQLKVDRDLLPDAHDSRWRLGLQLSDVELLFPAAKVS